MSETTTTTPATELPATPAPPDPGHFAHFMMLCNHAAALIYHDIVSAEASIDKWRSDNAVVANLFDQGVQYVSDTAAAFGLPVAQGMTVVKTIGAALKMMAANDSTVVSGTAVPAVPAP